MTWQECVLVAFAAVEMFFVFAYRRLVDKCIRVMVEQNDALHENTARWSKLTVELINDLAVTHDIKKAQQ